jgi:hypothetical protein
VIVRLLTVWYDDFEMIRFPKPASCCCLSNIFDGCTC